MLIKLSVEFLDRYKAKKREKNMIDFHDVEHIALKLLAVKDTEGRWIPTKAAREYREQFAQIMIDEYQDSNEVQELLLKCISGEDKGRYNRFMVGDVKQSIYKFRLARPEIFMEKYFINGKNPVIEGKSKKIYELDKDTFFMCFKPHLRSITSKREENIEGTDKERLISNIYFMNLFIFFSCKKYYRFYLRSKKRYCRFYLSSFRLLSLSELHIKPETPCAHKRIVQQILLLRVEAVGVQMLPGVYIVARSIHTHPAHAGLAGQALGKSVSQLNVFQTCVAGIHCVVVVLHMAHRTGVGQTRMRNFLPCKIAVLVPAVINHVGEIFRTFFLEDSSAGIVLGILSRTLEQNREVESLELCGKIDAVVDFREHRRIAYRGYVAVVDHTVAVEVTVDEVTGLGRSAAGLVFEIHLGNLLL